MTQILYRSFVTTIGLAWIMGGSSSSDAQPADREWPQTRAERTAYQETSSYADVIGFIEELQAKGASLSLRYIGSSDSGKRIPLVILANPPITTPSEARRLGKLVVYVQANIHAGEVEGKEASLMLMRDLCRQPTALTRNLVLLFAPIYNIDGNEALGHGPRTRSSQNGPGRIGQRGNGKGLDLNRDGVKAETPEMRGALAHIYTTWDPDVMLDLHTTNGTRHGYPLTYAPPLNPNTDPPVLELSRNMVGDIRRKLRKSSGLELQDYGNVEGSGSARAWRTVAPEPRYLTNYVGLRNRLAFLSEAASFLPFKTRVDVTYKFVEAILRECSDSSIRISRAIREADARCVRLGGASAGETQLGVRFEMADRGSESIPIEKTAPGETVNHMAAPTAFEWLRMPVYDRFKVSRTASLPAAYLMPAECTAAVHLLRRHGVVVERIGAWSGPVREFTVTESDEARSAFQGHRLVRLEGRFTEAQVSVPAGAYLVRTGQPLARLIFLLLEPESLDGLGAWQLLGWEAKVGARFPIRKVLVPVLASSEQVP